MRMVKQ